MPTPDIFAVGRGQYENIGDIILRRPLLRWARECGTLHVYVGNSPDGYDEGLGITGADRVYRSFGRWYAALVRSAAKGTAHSLYKPGEIQLTLVGMKEHVAMLPAATLVRVRGGAVGRVGVGARNFAAVPRVIMKPSNALSSYTRWRDDKTAAYLGVGAAMPDLGFAEGSPVEFLEDGAAGEKRDLLVVSLRDDTEVAPRPYPDRAWLDGIRLAADDLGLRIAVVTQVSVDDVRTNLLARDVGAEIIVAWPEPSDHLAQELRLREVYRRTAVAASDRLHVIVAAMTEGAAPVGLQLDDADKISRHFDTIGQRGVAVNSRGLSARELADEIIARAQRRGEALDALAGARERLENVRAELHELLAPRSVQRVSA